MISIYYIANYTVIRMHPGLVTGEGGAWSATRGTGKLQTL
jgi:hypothetical protein